MKSKNVLYVFVIWIVIIISLISCVREASNVDILKVSLAFNVFPKKYTCDGIDINPQITISHLPKDTKALALIMEDPDAPGRTFIHWVAWNITPTNVIPEGFTKTAVASKDKVIIYQGYNDFRKIGYGGPCPPRGHGIHHYHIKVYALDTALDLHGKITADILRKAMRKHIIGKGEAIATYQR